MRVLRVAWIGCLLAASCTIPRGIVQASDPVPPKAVIWIESIADSGGADQKMGDGDTLARRFTRGLRAALEGEAKERFDVRIAAHSVPASPPAVRFVLRGGLSRIQGMGAASSDQPYLCIVRLFQESTTAVGAKPTRRLVGQWAGTARGLRDLTGNLARDPHVHVLGLAGELSRRISIATLRLADSVATTVLPPSPSLSGDNSPPAVLILEGGTAAPSTPPPSTPPPPTQAPK